MADILWAVLLLALAWRVGRAMDRAITMHGDMRAQRKARHVELTAAEQLRAELSSNATEKEPA